MDELHTFYYSSPVGVLRLSGTESYISEVCFLDDAADNLHASDNKLPELLILCVEQLIQYFSGQRRIFELPPHQTGTSFQQKVWNELLNIKYGYTISYQDLSKKLGDPKVIRAAAAANGRNNIAIIVPCHRVIGANRELVGYAGGLWRKKWLLDHEKKFAYGVQTLF
jgi:methylated-DNA-[protein]-cysteine S-methyltransferase